MRWYVHDRMNMYRTWHMCTCVSSNQIVLMSMFISVFIRVRNTFVQITKMMF